MRCLVTGGCGFIGSHFVRLLVARGEDVVVLDKLTYAGARANLEGIECAILEGDVADPAAVSQAGAGCEAVVHFAAETHVDRSIREAEEFVRTNVVGTSVVLDWARGAGVRFLQVSTDEVYGEVPPREARSESDRLQPSSPYAATKAGGDLCVLASVRTHGVDACITRGANTFGPRQHREKFLPLMITRALARGRLPVYGDGRQRRQWIHVSDHCAAIDLVLRRGESGAIYNIGGEEHENLDVVHRVLTLTGASVDLIEHVADRPGHDRRYAVDDSKIRSLGWHPSRSLEDSLPETVTWYEQLDHSTP
jgi:dTDP-glucose 4,6-dehydratase